jgi:hypothetical protein
MKCDDVSCAKRARVLFRNEIQKIVMDSDSDKDEYYASQESEDEATPTFATVFHLTDSQAQIFPRFLRTKIVLWITTQKIAYKTSFHPPSV